MKILIANRGEIAVRIIKACHDLGLKAVAVYSEADKKSLHVALADESICIGKASSLKSYLKISNILSACDVTGADAVHPGYGFHSENENFASICKSCGLKFIGPNHEIISLLGNKANAKKIAQEVGCPIIPGSDGIVKNIEEAKKIAIDIGFPVFIKAAMGGGGKGLKVAFSLKEFESQFVYAQEEAKINFNNSDIYLEKMIESPRHVEVQVIGDNFSNFIHLGERDCSIQRNRQKLIEEAPCNIASQEIKDKMYKAALDIVKKVNYNSVGTVEFLLDKDQNFYFMEMNTRIQVEHPVTEELTNTDIVATQIAIAMGDKLPYKQSDIQFNGHVIEYRINAEDPFNNFCPSPGVINDFIPSNGPHVRLDSACYSSYEITPYYDSLIAKLIVRSKSRSQAINISKRALNEFYITGIKTTIPFHLKILNDKTFLDDKHDLNYVEKFLKK